MPAPYNSHIHANTIFAALVGEKNANLPDIDLTLDWFDIPWDENHAVYQTVKRIAIEELTTREVGGEGIFDALMASLAAHLKEEYNQGRITGSEYTMAYVPLTEGALSNSVQFALQRDQAFWMSAKAQADAITARVANETAKLQAMMGRAEYALTKLKLATEDSTFAAQAYQVDHLLPAQEQHILEQVESQRAQTMDTRTNGTTEVTGLIGRQKALYEQQVKSYQADVENKAAKIFSDLWVTQKTLDEAISPSPSFAVPTEDFPDVPDALDAIFQKMRKTAAGNPDLPDI